MGSKNRKRFSARTLGRYIFFQHLSHKMLPVSTWIHLPSSITFLHFTQAFSFLLRSFDLTAPSPLAAALSDVVVVFARIGSLGALPSPAGAIPWTVLLRCARDPVVEDVAIDADLSRCLSLSYSEPGCSVP